MATIISDNIVFIKMGAFLIVVLILLYFILKGISLLSLKGVKSKVVKVFINIVVVLVILAIAIGIISVFFTTRLQGELEKAEIGDSRYTFEAINTETYSPSDVTYAICYSSYGGKYSGTSYTYFYINDNTSLTDIVAWLTGKGTDSLNFEVLNNSDIVYNYSLMGVGVGNTEALGQAILSKYSDIRSGTSITDIDYKVYLSSLKFIYKIKHYSYYN